MYAMTIEEFIYLGGIGNFLVLYVWGEDRSIVFQYMFSNAFCAKIRHGPQTSPFADIRAQVSVKMPTKHFPTE